MPADSLDLVVNAPRIGIPYSRLDSPVASAEGAWVRTRSGRSYLDLGNMYGAVILGHAHPAIIAAVERVLTAGIQGCGGHPSAASIAERLRRCGAHADHHVLLLKTGTAAVRAAVELCRASSKRPIVATAGYHGWDSTWRVDRGLFEVNSAGVFDCFFVPEALDRFLRKEGSQVGALLVSPDYVHLSADTLRDLVTIARDHGLLVVSDEVKWGYRTAPGPSLDVTDLTADLYVYSKALGNGWPIALVAGPRALLAEGADFTSTLTFEAGSLAATVACLDALADGSAHARIREQSGRFLDAIRGFLAEEGWRGVEVVGGPHLFQIVFADERAEDAFYPCATEAGLLLFAGDNQTPSAGFTGDVVDEAVRRFRKAVHRTADGFEAALRRPVETFDRVRAAWNQMDGLAYENQDLVSAERTLERLLDEG